MRRRIVATVSAALALGLVFGFASPGMAAGFGDEDIPDAGSHAFPSRDKYIKKLTQPKISNSKKRRKFYSFNPSSNAARRFMINTGSKVLGEATPNSWRAEQLANQHRYDHSWEAFEEKYQAPAHQTAPETYEEYTVAKKDAQLAKNKMGEKLRKAGDGTPATKPGRFHKAMTGAVGGVFALTGLDMGMAIGNKVTKAAGFMPDDGAVCGSNALVRFGGQLLNGYDCDMWDMTQEAIENANSDVDADIVSGECLLEEAPDFGIPSSNPNFQDWPYVSMEGFASLFEAAESNCSLVYGVGSWVGSVYHYEWRSYVTSVDFDLPNVTVSYHADFVAPIPEMNDDAPSPSVACVYSGPDGDRITWATVPNGWLHRFETFDAEGTFICDDAKSGETVGAGVFYAGNLGAPGGIADPKDADSSRLHSVFIAGSGGRDLVPVEFGDSDPERTIDCAIKDTYGHTYTATSEAYREGDGSIAAPECPELPDGKIAESVSFTDSEGNELYEEDTTQAYKDYADERPDCVDGSCPLDLLIWDSDHEHLASCFDLADMCRGWFDVEEPTRSDTFQCRQGGQNLDIEECYIYSGVFQESRRAAGAPYSDPTTGVWTGGQNAPKPTEESMSSTVRDPDAARACNIGASPLMWVLDGVKCALEWAFVPRPAVVDVETEEMTEDWDDTVIGAGIETVGSWKPTLSASGCSIPGEFHGVEFDMLNACEGGMFEKMAGFSRLFTSITVVVVCALVFRRHIGAMIGYHPGGGGVE